MSKPALVTGASGFLGWHVARVLVERGYRVRALARPGSKTGFLEGLGVEIHRGDLTDPAACDRAVDDVAQVFHCAAKVGDWGSWREFQVGCIDATRTLAEASARAGINRFLHISSTSAYGHPPDQPTPIDETTALGQNVWLLDHYTRSKVECERLLWEMSAPGKLPLSGMTQKMVCSSGKGIPQATKFALTFMPWRSFSSSPRKERKLSRRKHSCRA